MAEGEDPCKPAVAHHPDGTYAYLAPQRSPGAPPPTYAPPRPPPPPFQHATLPQPQPMPGVVACVACGRHLMPPPGAPVFACICGQRMAQHPAAMQQQQRYAPVGVLPQQPAAVPAAPRGTDVPSHVPPAMAAAAAAMQRPPPAPPPPQWQPPAFVGGYGPPPQQQGAGMLGVVQSPHLPADAPRHIRCPRCGTVLLTNTAITLCGACGARIDVSPLRAPSVPAPVAAASVAVPVHRPRSWWDEFMNGI